MDLKNKISSTESEIENLRAELDRLAKTEIKSKTVENLEKSVQSAKDKLSDLEGKAEEIFQNTRSDLFDMGFDDTHLDSILEQNKEWNNLQKNILKADEELQKYKKDLKEAVESEGTVKGSDTEEYAKKQEKLKQLCNKLNVYKSKLTETEAKQKSFSKQTSLSRKTISMFSIAVKDVGKKIISAFKNSAVKFIKRLGTSAKSSSGQLSLLSKSLSLIKNAIRGMLIYKGISAVFSSIKEGMSDLAQASPEVNSNLSKLMTSLSYLKYSLTVAFAPILTVVTPILNGFITILTVVTDKVAQFANALLGRSVYTKAIKVQRDYAKSVSETTSATKKNTKAVDDNQKSLAGFDELNVMQDNTSVQTNTDDDTKTEIKPSDLFTTAPIENGISSFAKQVKDLFAKQDYKGIGSLIASKINSSLSSINWSSIKKTAALWGKNIANFLNGGIETLDWKLIGSTIGNGLMTAIAFSYAFLTTMNFQELGAGLANTLIGFLNSVDWSLVGATFGATLQAIIALGFGFVTQMNEQGGWADIGQSLSDLVNGFFNEIDWVMAAQTISDGILGLLISINTFLEETDWEQIGKDLGEFIAGIDWWGILTSSAKAIWNAIIGLFDLLAGVWEGSPIAAIILGIVAALGAFAVIMGIVNAVMAVNPITWVVLGIVALIAAIIACIAYWDKICDAIINAWNWWCGLFSGVGDWIWKNVISPIIGFFKTLWSNIKTILNKIKAFITKIWNGIWSIIKGVINLIIDGINLLWSGIYTAVSGIVNGLGTIAGAVGDLFGQDWSFSMPEEPPLIPKLATGTVVPANYGEFAAILGDNKREPEVVSPLSTIKQALKEVLSEGGFTTGDGDINLTINLDGEPIFKDTIKRNKAYKKTHGVSAYA